MRRQYTEDDKASALAYLDANRGNIEKTAKQTGYPRKTIEYWVRGNINPAVAKLRRIKRGELGDRYEDAAQMLVDCIPGKIEDAKLMEVTTSIGILTDKMRLLREQATSISKNANLNPEERADRVDELLETARTRRTGQPAPSESIVQ